jgi:hypothetical protein
VAARATLRDSDSELEVACTLGRVSRAPALALRPPRWQRTGRAGQVSLRSGHLLAYALIPSLRTLSGPDPGPAWPGARGSGPSLRANRTGPKFLWINLKDDFGGNLKWVTVVDSCPAGLAAGGGLRPIHKPALTLKAEPSLLDSQRTHRFCYSICALLLAVLVTFSIYVYVSASRVLLVVGTGYTYQ